MVLIETKIKIKDIYLKKIEKEAENRKIEKDKVFNEIIEKEA